MSGSKLKRSAGASSPFCPFWSDQSKKLRRMSLDSVDRLLIPAQPACHSAFPGCIVVGRAVNLAGMPRANRYILPGRVYEAIGKEIRGRQQLEAEEESGSWTLRDCCDALAIPSPKRAPYTVRRAQFRCKSDS